MVRIVLVNLVPFIFLFHLKSKIHSVFMLSTLQNQNLMGLATLTVPYGGKGGPCTTTFIPKCATSTSILTPTTAGAILPILIEGKPNENLMNNVCSIIASNPNSEDPFYILDLDIVSTLFDRWNQNLENVRPFYAVKCNPEPIFLAHLAALGCNFDCASRAEIETILSLGVSPDRIIYANPCKAESHIRLSEQYSVNLTTIDSIYELEKIKKHHPKCSLLLRIKPPHDVGVRQSFGSKCGALPEEIGPILRVARSMKLNIVGVSFHVGTDAAVVETYDAAIELAREVFDVATSITGSRMHILNIGGGFTASETFENTSKAIKSYLAAHFADWPGLTVMAEPGRYFAEKAFTLASCVIGKRVRKNRYEYWISDGMYGSMGCIRLDNAKVSLRPLKEREGKETYLSTVFGPTLDSIDVVGTDFQLPELEVGEWLISGDMGAYTKALGSEFNGFSSSSIRVHVAESL